MDKPVSMAARRRSMTGARSRAEGLGFEYLIDNACAYYLSRDIAEAIGKSTGKNIQVRPAKTYKTFSDTLREIFGK